MLIRSFNLALLIISSLILSSSIEPVVFAAKKPVQNYNMVMWGLRSGASTSPSSVQVIQGTKIISKKPVAQPATIGLPPSLQPINPNPNYTLPATAWYQSYRNGKAMPLIMSTIQKYNKTLSSQDVYTISKGLDVFSQYYNIDPKLLASLVAVESSFRPWAVSSSGAIGLGQLKPTTAEWLGIRNPYDPLENLFGSAKYLRYLLNKYNGSVRHALAAYYQGQGSVDRDGINPDADYYVSKIARAFNDM